MAWLANDCALRERDSAGFLRGLSRETGRELAESDGSDQDCLASIASLGYEANPR